MCGNGGGFPPILKNRLEGTEHELSYIFYSIPLILVWILNMSVSRLFDQFQFTIFRSNSYTDA